MKEEFIYTPININHAENRFEMMVDGYMAYIEFEIHNGIYSLTHTISPKEIGGRGVASSLIEKVLIYLNAEKQQFIPICPMVVNFIQKHPEWKKWIPKQYHEEIDKA
ncbi:MAG TPA: GNAT family N-acetyltransferase [Chitinophagales bacterium]|nr:GNAT family N-acetyltransferase [Chitinophagales bacterium]